MPIPFIWGLFQQATAQGSRSTVLRPLGWLASICTVGIVVLVELKAPAWIVAIFVAGFIAAVLLYLGAYAYCLFVDRDSLRSEKYSIQKLAIEKHIVGDSTVGILEIEETLDGSKLIGPGATKNITEEEKS